jgi:hypothetical protein
MLRLDAVSSTVPDLSAATLERWPAATGRRGRCIQAEQEQRLAAYHTFNEAVPKAAAAMVRTL